MADEEVLFSIGADGSGAIDTLNEIITGLNDLIATTQGVADALSPLENMDDLLLQIANSAGVVGGELGNLADSASAAEGGLFNLGGALEGLQGFMEGTIGRATELAGALLEFEAIGGAINAVRGFVGSMIGMNTQFQQLGVTLKNFVGSKQANDIIQWISSFGTKIPFTTSALEQSVVAVTALGQNAEKVEPALTALAAQMGVDLPTATRAFDDVVGSNRWLMFQNQLHVTKEELVPFGLELSKQGQVLNNSFVPAFERFVAARFPSALHDDMQTFGGELAEAEDKIQLLAARIGAPLFADFQQGLGAAMQWVDDHQDIINTLATDVGQGLADAFQGLGDAAQFAEPFLEDIGRIAGGLIGGTLQTLVGWVEQGAAWFKSLSGSLQLVETPFSNVEVLTRKVGGQLHVLKGDVDGTTAKFQELAGPLAPIAGLFQDIQGAIQSVVAWFTPMPDHTEKVGVAIKKWVGTKDGVDQWKTTMKTVLVDVPGQASGFVQFLNSLKQAFTEAFNDENGQKAHALAQALKDAGDALLNVGQWLTSGGLATLQGLATLLGDIASAAAGFFKTLQDNHAELVFFNGILTTIAITAGVRAAQGLGELGASALIAGNRVLTLAKTNLPYLEDAFGAIADSAKDAWGWLKNKLEPVFEETGTKAEESAGKVQSLAGAEQAVGTNAEAAAPEVQSLATQAEVTGANAEAAAPEVETLATNTETLGVNAATAAPELDTMAASEETVGMNAEASATQMDTLSASTQTLGDSSTAAIGEAGVGGGAGLGLAGLIALIVYFGNDLTLKASADWITNQLTTAITNLGQEASSTVQAMDQLTHSVEALGQGLDIFTEHIDPMTAAIQDANNMLLAAKKDLLDYGDAAKQVTGDIADIATKWTETWKTLKDHPFPISAFGPGGPPGAGSGSGSSGGSSGAGVGAGHRAMGGPVFAGQSYEVGEWGPETFVPDMDGFILPANLTQMMQPTIDGLSLAALAALTSGLAGASTGLGNTARMESLLVQLIAAVQQQGRAPALGAQPVPAQTGSVFQQNNTFNGMQALPTLYAELNMLGGLAAEYAKRGFVNP